MNRTREESAAPSVRPGGPMNGDVLSALLRYIDRYQWSFNTAMRLINLYYGTAYTEKELKRLYRGNRTAPCPGPNCRPGRSRGCVKAES